VPALLQVSMLLRREAAETACVPVLKPDLASTLVKLFHVSLTTDCFTTPFRPATLLDCI
jgi:hypothetical protein